MGMVFATRRTWIEPEHLSVILQDDDYRQISSESELIRGDLVVYRDDAGSVSHVGVVAEVHTNVELATYEITVLSQWGRDGEYFHRADDVSAYLGKPTEYWTDRVWTGNRH